MPAPARRRVSFIEYHALAMLSETPDHTRRMSDLATVTNASLSRYPT